MAETTPGTQLPLFTDAFRQALADALQKALASTWNVQASSENVSPADGSLCCGISPSGNLPGNATFQLRQSDAVFLAQKILAEPPDVSAEMTEARKQAVEKFLSQVAELAAAGLKTHFGDLSFQVSTIEPPAWAGVTVALTAS